MVRQGRKNRVNNVTHSRAIVRETASGWVTDLDPIEIDKRAEDTVETPAQLRALIQAQGGIIRVSTSGRNGRDIVTHPNGKQFTMMRNWDIMQMARTFALRAAQGAGFVLYPVDHIHIEEPLMPAIGESVSPAAVAELARAAKTRQSEHDSLVEYVESLKDRIVELEAKADLHDARIDRLRVENGELRSVLKAAVISMPAEADPYQQYRDIIMEWFRKLPAGMMVNASSMFMSLNIAPEAQDRYRRQLRVLVDRGELLLHGGNKSGTASHFSLNPDSQKEEAS